VFHLLKIIVIDHDVKNFQTMSDMMWYNIVGMSLEKVRESRQKVLEFSWLKSLPHAAIC